MCEYMPLGMHCVHISTEHTLGITESQKVKQELKEKILLQKTKGNTQQTKMDDEEKRMRKKRHRNVNAA